MGNTPNALDDKPQLKPTDSATIGPSGFRTNTNRSLKFSPDEVADLLEHIEDEVAYDDPNAHLLSEMNETAKKNGIIDGDFKYIKQENILPDITNKFTYIKQLGFGGSCRVLLVKENESDIKYALKELICDDEYNPNLFKKEIRLLSTLNHPNILKYYQSYMDASNLYIATHYLYGGDLFQKLKQYKIFTERIAAKIIYTIIDALHYMHKLGIVHRDIKPENIVFDKPGPDGKLCIIDFGDSEIVEDDEMYNEFVGTLHYLPPEITRYRHGWELKKGDMWSIGVLTYQLLCGQYPFYGINNAEIITKIKLAQFGWPKNVILSQSVKQFIRLLIRKNVTARLSAKDALKNKWFIHANDKDLGDGLLSTLSDVGEVNKVKHILQNVLMNELGEKEKDLLIKAFKEIDGENKGYIERKDVETLLIGLKMERNIVAIRTEQIMENMDKEKNGKIVFCNVYID